MEGGGENNYKEKKKRRHFAESDGNVSAGARIPLMLGNSLAAFSPVHQPFFASFTAGGAVTPAGVTQHLCWQHRAFMHLPPLCAGIQICNYLPLTGANEGGQAAPGATRHHIFVERLVGVGGGSRIFALMNRRVAAKKASYFSTIRLYRRALAYQLRERRYRGMPNYMKLPPRAKPGLWRNVALNAIATRIGTLPRRRKPASICIATRMPRHQRQLCSVAGSCRSGILTRMRKYLSMACLRSHLTFATRTAYVLRRGIGWRREEGHLH